MVELWHPQRKLGGAFSVDECARRLMHYRYAEVEMMRALLQWIATQPQVHHKVEFGPIAYQDAQHADMLGKRLPELRMTEGAEGPYPLMTSPKMEKLFGGPPRRPESEITRREMDLAASIQAVTE